MMLKDALTSFFSCLDLILGALKEGEDFQKFDVQ